MKLYTQKHSLFPAPDTHKHRRVCVCVCVGGVIKNCDPGQDHYYVGGIG